MHGGKKFYVNFASLQTKRRPKLKPKTKTCFQTKIQKFRPDSIRNFTPIVDPINIGVLRGLGEMQTNLKPTFSPRLETKIQTSDRCMPM